jgi:Flp pilus assembly protein TadG
MTHPKRFHRVLTALRSSSVATALVSFASGFFSKLSAFRTARGANVAVTFALATLPIVTAVGAAVDYSHANAVKAALQSALDSTALMLAKNAATVTNSALQTEALSYFNGLFTAVEATNVAVDATYTSQRWVSGFGQWLGRCAHEFHGCRWRQPDYG